MFNEIIAQKEIEQQLDQIVSKVKKLHNKLEQQYDELGSLGFYDTTTLKLLLKHQINCFDVDYPQF